MRMRFIAAHVVSYCSAGLQLQRVLVECGTVGDRHPAHVKNDLTIDDPGETIGGEVMRPLLRHYYKMGVSNATTSPAVNETSRTAILLSYTSAVAHQILLIASNGSGIHNG